MTRTSIFLSLAVHACLLIPLALLPMGERPLSSGIEAEIVIAATPPVPIPPVPVPPVPVPPVPIRPAPPVSASTPPHAYPPPHTASRPRWASTRMEPAAAPDSTPVVTAMPPVPGSAGRPQPDQSVPVPAGLSPAGPSAVDIARYDADVWSLIRGHTPPRVMIPGTATVRFRLSPQGELVSAEIGQTSGNSRLDDLALSILRACAPFPTAPPGAAPQDMVFLIPFEFRTAR